MADEYTKLLYGLAGVGIATFVGWAVTKIANLNTRVAVLESKEGGIKDMKSAVDKLTAIVYEIAGKLGIPIRGD